MNKLRQIPFKTLVLLLCFIITGAYGQAQTKTFKETFMVSKDAILDVNTSHADIEFETWSKDQIEIEATIELEGATEEEAERYFEDSGFEILGNSKKVTVSTGKENASFWSHPLGNAQNFHIEMPEFPEINSYTFDFDLEELSNIPMPPIPAMAEFDHKAFKKEGEKYLKKWQKEFEEGYDEEHVKELEEWGKRMEEKQEKMQKRREKLMDERSKLHEKREQKLNERHEKMEEARVKRMESQQERRAYLLERKADVGNANGSSHVVIINGDSISTYMNGNQSIFYSSSNGLNKNYKVKKTITIKIPKGMKIKMNVRHGQVKLAENTKNLNAMLSHSSLWASTIDGDQTTISASYSPVNVQNWNYGQLQAKYSDNVALKEVLNLRLDATSSDVTIDNLIHSAFIKNDFGPLHIKSVSNNFKAIDITLQNAELNCKTPSVPFTISVNGTSSKLTTPNSLSLERTKNFTNTIHSGFFKSQNTESSININAKYSDVVLD
jgi:hypothetical protein